MRAEKRTTSTAECKREAVRLVTEPHDGVAEAARHLGSNTNMLRRWKRESTGHEHGAFPGQGRLSPAQEALHRLCGDCVVVGLGAVESWQIQRVPADTGALGPAVGEPVPGQEPCARDDACRPRGRQSREPVAAGASFRDTDEVCGFGWPLADEGCRGRRDKSPRRRDLERRRPRQSHPYERPCRRRVCETATWVTSECADDGAPSGGTSFGTRTRVSVGVNLPPLEVIMSRLHLYCTNTLEFQDKCSCK